MHAQKTPTTRASDEARVSLVFPPLVVEGLGRYYPSTAVLAGHLAARGVKASQVSLNELFANELLAPAELEKIGRGEMPDGSRVELTHITAVSARVLCRYFASCTSAEERAKLVTGPERRRSTSPAYLASELLESFILNDQTDKLCSAELADSPKGRHLRDFYARSRYVEELGPKVHTVGISVPMGPQLGPALLLARHVKALRPDLKVILGGPTLSLMARRDLDHLLRHVPEIDAVVKFEGEVPLAMLVDQQERGVWDPAVVPGVAVLVDGRLHETPPAAGVRLEDLAYPEYEPAILDKMPGSPIGIVQARGCYWGKCTYCDYVELYEGSPRYRTRLPESFVDEMEHQIRKHDRRNFTIVTESIPASFARRMSEAIIARGLDLRWNSFAMVDRRFTLDVLETMRRGGCAFLVIGLETLNTRVLKLVEKAADREMNLEFLRNAKRAGIKLRVNLIIDLPTTTHAEALENLETLESVRECLDSVAVFPFEPTRSSAIGRNPGRFGLKVLDATPSCGDSETLNYVSNRLGSVDLAMTDAERADAYRRYYDFADSINRSVHHAEVGIGAESRRYFRFAEEHLDVLDAGSFCYNWVTRKTVTLTEDWRELLDLAKQKPRFQRSWFERQFSERSEGKRLFDLLVEEHFLVPSEQTSAREG